MQTDAARTYVLIALDKNTEQYIKNKLAPYGTYGRLLLTANFKVT